MISKFDDIRPYDEKEFLAAMERIATSDVFPLLASFVYPTEPLEDVRQRVRAFKTVSASERLRQFVNFSTMQW